MLKISKSVSPTQTSLPWIPDSHIHLLWLTISIWMFMDISSLTHSQWNLSLSQPTSFQQRTKLSFSCLGQKALESLWTPLPDTHISKPSGIHKLWLLKHFYQFYPFSAYTATILVWGSMTSFWIIAVVCYLVFLLLSCFFEVFPTQQSDQSQPKSHQNSLLKDSLS